MADVCADLINHLSHNAGIIALVDERVYGGVVPAGASFPFIWLQRRGVEESGALEAEALPFKELFDLECVSLNATEAVAISDAIRTCLNGAHGAIGSNVYSWVSVADAAESYVPRNIDAAEFLFVSSLNVEVFRP
jgi:hypothetical protein